MKPQLKQHASYSNSAYDLGNETGFQADETSTRDMYEYSPYPDLGADLKTQELYMQHLDEAYKSQRRVYFDAGCGTGHYVVGVAKKYPHWRCIGMDLSQAAIDIAQELARKHGVTNVEFFQGSYFDPIPVQEPVDIISAMGTIHHCADPEKAMKIMHNLLAPDGYMFLHMYGWRADQEKFDIKTMLDILEPDLRSYEKRFHYYRSLMDHRQGKILKRIANTSLYDIYDTLRIGYRNWKRRINKISWSPPWHNNYTEITSPWIDHFCHPCERAYEVPAIQMLLQETDFKVVKMLSQGKEFPQLIPAGWRPRYDSLDFWSKARLSELLATGGGSFAMVLQKA